MSEFWNMGGYGLFVWGSYGAGLAVFVWNLIAPRLQRREVLRRLRGELGERPRGEAQAGLQGGNP